MSHTHVKYCGPTSTIHDHHVRVTAERVNHIWTASIIAGLAVVATGTLLYTSEQFAAAKAAENDTSVKQATMELRELNQRIQKLENKL